MKIKPIYHVKLFEPIEDKTDYYFSSIKAIFDMFGAERVGVARQTLYQKSMEIGDEYRSKYCVIKKEQLIGKQK
ncbi:hypothetical protein [Chryseobacterium sp. JV274]|uniref:hypothetical protein n=1 Tax=Chryseobacterium sp. JV274 TaxID=1932669 RepID=UPI00098767D0|nr:hypothetical protein [Chryseobacterium sp. JV274]